MKKMLYFCLIVLTTKQTAAATIKIHNNSKHSITVWLYTPRGTVIGPKQIENGQQKLLTSGLASIDKVAWQYEIGFKNKKRFITPLGLKGHADLVLFNEGVYNLRKGLSKNNHTSQDVGQEQIRCTFPTTHN